jgi:hypothetical protein
VRDEAGAELATICGACVATATGGGTPRRMSAGVSRKPPPTPNTPDRNPTTRAQQEEHVEGQVGDREMNGHRA